MASDLLSILPQLLPKVIGWAEKQSAELCSSGMALTERGQSIAKAAGVTHAEKIRISIVSSIPIPDDPVLQKVAIETGLLGPDTAGLTLGYGIYIRAGKGSAQLLSHECRHVYQYETFGSIGEFMSIYLQQIAQYGYEDAPLEVDAREHEISGGFIA